MLLPMAPRSGFDGVAASCHGRSLGSIGTAAWLRVFRARRLVELLAELGELDLHAVAPAADLDRGFAHGAADGADVAVVLAEELDDALAEDAIFGAQAGDARGEGGADGFGEVVEADLARVGEGDGGAQGLLELADVEGPGVAEEGARGGAVEGDALGVWSEARQDRGDEGAEVFAAVAEWGEDHLEAGEARVEVLAE